MVLASRAQPDWSPDSWAPLIKPQYPVDSGISPSEHPLLLEDAIS